MGRGVYQFEAAVFATLSTMNVFFNTCFCRWFYGAAMTPLIDLGFRILGALMIVIAAVSYSLQVQQNCALESPWMLVPRRMLFEQIG